MVKVNVMKWLRFNWEKGVTCKPLDCPIRPRASLSMPLASSVPFNKTRLMQAEMLTKRDYRPTCFAPNLANELEAVKARVLKQTPQVDQQEMAGFVAFVKNNVRKLFPAIKRLNFMHPHLFERYLENSNASPAVKRILRETKASLDAQGIGPNTKLTKALLRQYTKRSAFVKVEENLYSTPLDDLDKAPRLIQGGTPEFIVLVGPALMLIQQFIKSCWNGSHFCYFTSGAQATDTADYITSEHVSEFRIFENDVSAFDCSISRPLLELEVWLTKLFGAGTAVCDLMRENISTRGRTHHGIKYKVEGTRKSGDPYTSVYNSVLNGLMHIYCVVKSGVEVHNLHQHVRMLVQGDDNLLRHSPHLQIDWSILLRLGFKAESIYHNDLVHAEFCSSRLYKTNKGMCFGPKIGKVLGKYLSFVNPPLNVDPEALARGVALGLKASTSFVPLLREVVERTLELTKGKKPAYQHPHEPWKMVHTSGLVADEGYARYMLQEVYELTPFLTDEALRFIKTFKFGDVISAENRGLWVVLDKDTSGPKLIFPN